MIGQLMAEYQAVNGSVDHRHLKTFDSCAGLTKKFN